MRPGFVVPVREKLAYGVGDCAINVAYGSMGFYMLWFMVNVGGVSPAMAGAIFAVARIWDAVADYLFGRASDRTRHRLGRRRPFIVYGAVPLGISFVLLWVVPFQGSALAPGALQWLRFGYYLLVYVLFETAFAAVSIPYGSLMPEMTQDYDERSVLSGFRLGSSFVGTLLGAAGVMLVTDVLLAGVPRPRSFLVMSVAFAAIMIALLLVAGLGSRERVVERAQAQGHPLDAVRSFFAMREFRAVVAMFVLNMIGVDVLTSLIAFYLKDAVGIADDVAFAFMALPLVTALAFSPVWVILSGRMGKPRAYVVSAVYMAAVLLGCLFVPRGSVAGVAACAFGIGIGMSAAQIIPWSILPDVVEIDEYRNGVRREGEYYGLVTFVYKVLSGLTIMAVGQLLGAFGYVERSSIDAVAAAQAVVQPASAVGAVRVLTAVLPGLFFVGSAVAVARLPITRERFEEIRAALKARG